MHVDVVELDAAELEELRPLWLAMRDHHAALTPDWPRVRADDDSWSRRRAQYDEWLEDEDNFALVARDADGRAVGYAVVTLSGGGPTWDSGRTAEVESLAVDRERRGEGIGRRLLAAVDARVAALGVDEQHIGYVVANEGAARFYAREGYEAAWVIVRRRGQPPMGAQP